jgi:hypothetical protein
LRVAGDFQRIGDHEKFAPSVFDDDRLDPRYVRTEIDDQVVQFTDDRIIEIMDVLMENLTEKEIVRGLHGTPPSLKAGRFARKEKERGPASSNRKRYEYG